MLAVLGLTASLSSPGRGRVAALPVKPEQLAFGVAGVVGVLAIGAALSWGGIYVGGSLRPIREVVIAAIMLFAVLAQPVIAAVLALGLKVR